VCGIRDCSPTSLATLLHQESLTPSSSRIATDVVSWLDDYITWLTTLAPCCFRNASDPTHYCASSSASLHAPECQRCYNLTQNGPRPTGDNFKKDLHAFLNSSCNSDCAVCGTGHISDVVLTADNQVSVSRFWSYHTVLENQADYIDTLKASRTIASTLETGTSLDIFAYSVFYIYFEQYLYIQQFSGTILTVCAVTVFVLCAVNLQNLLVALIIIANLAMNLIEMLGLMYAWGIALNAVSVSNLVLAMGVSVEYCVHFAVTWMEHDGSRDQRTRSAITTVGGSLYRGLEASILGIVWLGLSSSQVFVIYFFRMYLLMFFLSLFHSMMVLPMMLSLVGPNYDSHPILFWRQREGKKGSSHEQEAKNVHKSASEVP